MLALLLAAAALPPGTKMLDGVSQEKVTLIPIVRESARPAGEYLTLKQALKDRIVSVKEHGDVNSVVVENRGHAPLLLVGGEMILGGQQDRIIGQDTLVPPGKKAVVGVYCVEHGRWSGAQQFGAAGGMVDSKVRAKAKVAHDQQQVWNEVARKTEAMGARTETGTYRAVGEKAAKDIRRDREALANKLDALPQGKEIVGLAAAVNGRIVSVDVFAAPQLFKQYRDSILDAALVGAEDEEAKPQAPRATPEAVESFLKKAPATTLRAAGGEAVYQSSVSAE
jgi:hypothetical protein